MSHFTLDHPAMLWLLIGIVPAAIMMVRSRRSELTGRGRFCYTVLRSLICGLLIMALAKPSVRWEQTETPAFGITVLRDVSGSMKTAGATSDGKVAALKLALAPGATVRLLDFAATAAPEGSAIDRTQTNLEAALDVVFADTAAAPATPVIVISDGRETHGVAERAARRFAARGGAIHVVPVGVANNVPPQLLRIEPSAGARVGVPVRFCITAESTSQESVEVVLRDGAGQVLDRCRSSIIGERAVVLSATPRRSGPNQFAVELRRGGIVCDALPAIAFVSGPPRCLLVDAFPDETDEFRKAIAPLGLDIEVCAPDGFPKNLSGYAAIALSDLSGSELDQNQRDMVHGFVEMGGGMIFMGGANSVPDRWKGNSIANLLPFKFAPPVEQPSPKRQVTVCYVLDRSGSMGQPLQGNLSKLDLVKAAIHASLRDLPAEAKVAVVVFDGQPSVVVSPTPVIQRQQIDDVVDRIILGGGTAMGPALGAGLEILAQAPGERYLVVLTDGQSQPAAMGWGTYTQQALALGANWTSISVGPDADEVLMQQLAQAAHGQAFSCPTGNRIPKVFIAQARQVGKAANAKRAPFRPTPGRDFGMLRSIDAADIPELADAIDTQDRPGASVLLSGRGGMPLLAWWRVGVGNVVAFSSSPKPDWAPDWPGWGRYSAFWSQLLQRCLHPPAEVDLKAKVFERDGQVSALMEASSPSGDPVTGLSCSAQLMAVERGAISGSRHAQIRWSSPRPGLYEAQLSPDAQPQVACLQLQDTEGRQLQYALTARGRGSDEMQVTGPNLARLKALAEAGHGICSEVPAEIARACELPKPIQRMQHFDLCTLAMFLAIIAWIMDLGVRKWLAA